MGTGQHVGARHADCVRLSGDLGPSTPSRGRLPPQQNSTSRSAPQPTSGLWVTPPTNLCTHPGGRRRHDQRGAGAEMQPVHAPLSGVGAPRKMVRTQPRHSDSGDLGGCRKPARRPHGRVSRVLACHDGRQCVMADGWLVDVSVRNLPNTLLQLVHAGGDAAQLPAAAAAVPRQQAAYVGRAGRCACGQAAAAGRQAGRQAGWQAGQQEEGEGRRAGAGWVVVCGTAGGRDGPNNGAAGCSRAWRHAAATLRDARHEPESRADDGSEGTAHPPKASSPLCTCEARSAAQV